MSSEHSHGHEPSRSREYLRGRVRLAVLAGLCLAAAISYICRNSLGVAEKSIREDLGLTNLNLFGLDLSPEDQMGWVMGAFALTYALFQLPTGSLAQTWGTRRALPLFALLWSAATVLFAAAGGVPMLLAARLGLGAAQSGIFPCSTNTTAKWFPLTERALASGALGAFMSVGGAVGTSVTGAVLEAYGPGSWRWLFLLFSVPGVLWAVWFYLWFRDEPGEHRSVTDLELQAVAGPTANRKDGAAPERPGPTPWGALVSSPAMGWICAQQFFRAAGYTFFTSWFATYLQETRHVSTRDAGFLNSLPLLAVVVGSMAGGFLSDRLQARTGSRRVSRQGLAVVSLLCCAGLTVLAYPIGNAWLAVLVVSGGSFFASMAGPCAYTITMDMGGKHLVAVFSLMNLAGNVGAALFPVVVPRLVAGTGSWDLVLFLFAGIFAAAAACWLFLNPAGTVLDQSLARTRTE